ncbi:MAG: TatD family hydrolase [Thermosphaera sp.]
MLIDMHVHCHELDVIDSYAQGFTLVCVAEDLASSRAVVELARKYSYVKPCVGIHPWKVEQCDSYQVRELLETAISEGVECIGEVGLDTRFMPQTITRQREIFNIFLEYAREYDLILNLHTAGTHREVFHLLIENKIERAYFHWYTGPEDMIKHLVENDYLMGLNPSWMVQENHKKIVSKIPLTHVLTESDAPYEYRGMVLKPELISESIDLLAKTHGLDREYVEKALEKNFNRVFKQLR